MEQFRTTLPEICFCRAFIDAAVFFKFVPNHGLNRVISFPHVMKSRMAALEYPGGDRDEHDKACRWLSGVNAAG